MLSLQSLLNPAPSNGRTAGSRQPTRAAAMSLSTPDATASSRETIYSHLTLKRIASRNVASLLKPKTQGPVRFPPFEDVDEVAMREIARYQISSFGQIQQCCEHIPYNSTKKDFYEKTGRESLEAFKYEFRIPGQHTTHQVMWDYNIGLVRMTPFFKCLGYPKMLDKNPGLREISPSITGGSVSAQGYWMPYRCARAVCATFCHDIAGALIPLFGPDFPSECTPPESKFFGDMVINYQYVVEATIEADASRHAYGMRRVAALNGQANGQFRFENCTSSKPLRNEALHPHFRQSARPMPAGTTPMYGIDGCQLAPHAGSVSRSGLDAETIHAHCGSGISLAPTNLPRRQHQSFQVAHHFHDATQARTSTTPRVATDSWALKRRRADRDYPYARGRPKAARLGWDMERKEDADGKGAGERGEELRTPGGGGEDYAAAAVLVRLQTEDQELSAATLGPAVDGSSARPRTRHRANSC